MRSTINTMPNIQKPNFKISEFDYIALDLMPQQIILKAKKPIANGYYEGIKNMFLNTGIKVIIIPSDFEIIAIDNKILVNDG